MPRGPYQGTFQPNVRPTVVTAPDAIVYINGEAEVIGCPQCNRFFDVNKFITQIQVDLSIDSVPGSASIDLAIPRHTIDEFYFDGNPVITPMMEVEIYAKGYYLLEGLPQYYPIFWGVTTEVADNYSGGEHTVSIHCADILKWWEVCKMNTNPAFTAPAGQQGRSLFGNVFFGMNPYDVIWSLALQSYGDVLVGTGSLVSLVKESSQRATFDAALSDLMLYWERRFSRIRSNMLLYGTNGVAVRGDSLFSLYSTAKSTPGRPFASQAVRNANGGSDGGQMVFDPADPGVVAFRTQFQQAGQVNFWQSEYQTKLELANAAKEAAGFEFFMDVDGSIVFKPPFYNLDVLSNKPVSWIQDIDIIDWNFSESEAEVVTQIVMQGSFGGNVDYGLPEECTPFSSVTDYHLLRKYGWRSQTYNSEFLGDPLLMFYHGMDILDRLNSKRHRGTVSIPLRPELRLGFPVYVAPKDQVWYTAGISHSIQFGGRAQTSLTLTSKRSKFVAPKGIGTINLKGFKGNPPTPLQLSSNSKLSFPYTSRQLAKNANFELKVGNAATLPPTPSQLDAGGGADNPYDPLILRHPKTGRIMGYPNVVMVYTRPFSPASSDLKSIQGQKTKANPQASKQLQGQFQAVATQSANDIDARFAVTAEDRLREKHLTNRYQYGLNSAGVYIYAHDKSIVSTQASQHAEGVIGEILLLPSANIAVTPAETNPLHGSTSMIRPVSDERGFEVIGHFRYGRRVALRDGRLVLGDKNNLPANVTPQLALGGDLFAALQSQSQGITAISSTSINPSATIASLQPDDLQTAAVVNPDTGQPQFSDVGDNFVDAAPLGSPAQKGTPVSVEASQLSRALTLAEMAIKDPNSPGGDDDCPCLTGRADLAFINVGYQLQTISTTSPDNTGLYNQATGAPSQESAPVAEAIGTTSFQSDIDQLTAQRSALEDELSIARLTKTKLSVTSAASSIFGGADSSAASQAADAHIQDLQNRIAGIQSQIDSLQTQLSQFNMNQGGGIPSKQSVELISRVETFLVNLYKTLDEPHQQYEHALRGDLLPGGAGPDGSNPEPDFQTPDASQFAPPFSPGNRLDLGDTSLSGVVAQGNTAVNDLTNQWTSFGNNLKNSAKKTALQQDISKNLATIQHLQAEKNQLQQAAGSANVVGTDPQTRIAQIDQQIAQLQQQIAQDQAQLNQLPGPPAPVVPAKII